MAETREERLALLEQEAEYQRLEAVRAELELRSADAAYADYLADALRWLIADARKAPQWEGPYDTGNDEWPDGYERAHFVEPGVNTLYTVDEKHNRWLTRFALPPLPEPPEAPNEQ